MPPLRVVLDRRLRTPAGIHVLDGSAPTLLLHAAGARTCRRRFTAVERAVVAPRRDGPARSERRAGAAGRSATSTKCTWRPVRTLCGALFAAGLVDELLLYIAPVLLGDEARPLLQLPSLSAMAERWQLETIDQRACWATDWRLRLRPRA